MTNLLTPLPPPSAKMNSRSIVKKQYNPQTRDKFQDSPTPLLFGRHKRMIPNVFEISLIPLN